VNPKICLGLPNRFDDHNKLKIKIREKRGAKSPRTQQNSQSGRAISISSLHIAFLLNLESKQIIFVLLSPVPGRNLTTAKGELDSELFSSG